MNNKSTMGIIAIMLGVLVALIPMVIFPVCSKMVELTNGKTLFMKCYWTARVEVLFGILIVFDGILNIIFRKYETRIVLSIMLFLLGLTTLLIPTVVIGMCETSNMPCHAQTEPALILVSILIMAVGIVNILFETSSMKSVQRYKESSVIR